MKILMLSDYFAPHIGGVEHAVLAIASRLVQQGHSVHVLTLNTDGAPVRETLHGVVVHRARALDLTRLVGVQTVWSIDAVSSLLRLADEIQPDIIHAHNLFFSTTLIAAALKRHLARPLVVTMHLGTLDCISGPARIAAAGWERTVGRSILRCADRVIAVSQAVAKHAAALRYPASSTRVIPNGVDLDRFFPSPDSTSDHARVGLVGRLIFNKGPRYFVESVPAVLEMHPRTEFVLAGEGPLRDELERRVAQLGIGHAVTFLGKRTDIPDILRTCDLYVRPSLTEGLPLTVLEAMACGVPVIATPVGGTAEVVQDGVTGLLIRPGEVDDLARATNDLLANPSRGRALAHQARALVQRSFNWDAVTRQTTAVYQELIHTESVSWPREDDAPLLAEVA